MLGTDLGSFLRAASTLAHWVTSLYLLLWFWYEVSPNKAPVGTIRRGSEKMGRGWMTQVLGVDLLRQLVPGPVLSCSLLSTEWPPLLCHMLLPPRLSAQLHRAKWPQTKPFKIMSKIIPELFLPSVWSQGWGSNQHKCRAELYFRRLMSAA